MEKRISRANALAAISNTRFTENCHAGMICGFTSISGAPKMLVIFTEPERMSYMSGMILIRTDGAFQLGHDPADVGMFAGIHRDDDLFHRMLSNNGPEFIPFAQRGRPTVVSN